MASRGRPRKYLTINQFEKFKTDDFYHLVCKVNLNNKRNEEGLYGFIAATLIEKLLP